MSKNDEALRAIAYSMDLLIPGFYLWFGRIRIRIGGVALVLPKYHIFTTYQGTLDPK